MLQTDEAELLRAESDRIAKVRRDAILNEARDLTVTEAINATFDIYPNLTEDIARALAWGWVESMASRCEWDGVRLVIAAYRARFPKAGQ